VSPGTGLDEENNDLSSTGTRFPAFRQAETGHTKPEGNVRVQAGVKSPRDIIAAIPATFSRVLSICTLQTNVSTRRKMGKCYAFFLELIPVNGVGKIWLGILHVLLNS
jgi:hypothetical protein